MDDILTTILKNTYSLTQLKHRLRVLKSTLSSRLFGGESKEEFATSDSTWLSSLPPQFMGQFTKDNLNEIFTQLETKINGLKILVLYLPFDADEQTLTQIGEFARKTFSNLIVLDMKFDPNLIAGAALSWNGVYKDYSLRSKIAEKKGEILESFKKFLR